MNSSIHQNMLDGKYSNDLAWPQNTAYQCGCGAGYGWDSEAKFCSECGADIQEAKAFHFKAIQEEKDAYQEETIRVNALFKQDVFDDLGISDNPKRELLWSKAYERGHSAGMHEVYLIADDLVELIR